MTKKTNEEKMIIIPESKYLFAKEMYQHYKELYEVALKEYQFKSLNVQHLLTMLEEVVELLSQGKPHLMIAKVIDNGIDRYNMDINIHNSNIADGQTNFSDIKNDEEECNEEEEYNDDVIDNGETRTDEEEEAYNYFDLLKDIKCLVDHYMEYKNDKN